MLYFNNNVELKFKLLDKLDITLTYWKHFFDSFIWHCTLCIHLNRFKIVAQEHGLYVVCLLGIVALVSSLQRVYLGGLLGNCEIFQVILINSKLLLSTRISCRYYTSLYHLESNWLLQRHLAKPINHSGSQRVNTLTNNEKLRYIKQIEICSKFIYIFGNNIRAKSYNNSSYILYRLQNKLKVLYQCIHL